MKKIHLLYITLLIVIAILLIANLLQPNGNNTTPILPTDSDAVDWEGRQMLQQAFNNSGGIAIPGFDSLYFNADQTTQKVNFFNPDINDCLFKMSLLVDETILWESENVAPGKGYYQIDLSKPLPIGEYSAFLKVNCFTLNGEPLNGASVEFRLIVQ